MVSASQSYCENGRTFNNENVSFFFFFHIEAQAVQLVQKKKKRRGKNMFESRNFFQREWHSYACDLFSFYSNWTVFNYGIESKDAHKLSSSLVFVLLFLYKFGGGRSFSKFSFNSSLTRGCRPVVLNVPHRGGILIF